ncbi:MAG TPA: retropepsin-like aspartic protease [Burkholderiaceae bacterium]|jgi:aspartyl protease family protein
MRALIAAAVLLAAAPAFAQSVSMSGSLGSKALLVIDGAPRTVASGETVLGVKLVSVSGSDAVVEVKGKRVTLAMGGAQVNLGGVPSEGGGSKIVLSAGSGGHFFTTGTINGHSVRFVVDTGATLVSMGADQARELGVDYTKGQRGIAGTANGQMVAYKVKLASVRVGDVQLYDVDGLVSQQPMEVILLGNSFLSRFQMARDNDTMTLTKRY